MSYSNKMCQNHNLLIPFFYRYTSTSYICFKIQLKPPLKTILSRLITLPQKTGVSIRVALTISSGKSVSQTGIPPWGPDAIMS